MSPAVLARTYSRRLRPARMTADQDGTGLLAQIRRISPEKFADLLRICGRLPAAAPQNLRCMMCVTF
jgi:hypothetical protein